MSSALRWAENLIPIAQPPHTPELTPLERVYHFINAQLKTEGFATLEQLRAQLARVFEQMRTLILSLVSDDFILAG